MGGGGGAMASALARCRSSPLTRVSCVRTCPPLAIRRRESSHEPMLQSWARAQAAPLPGQNAATTATMLGVPQAASARVPLRERRATQGRRRARRSRGHTRFLREGGVERATARFGPADRRAGDGGHTRGLATPTTAPAWAPGPPSTCCVGVTGPPSGGAQDRPLGALERLGFF